MFRIDPARLDLAREFRRTPYGIHSPDLQAVLTVMRSLPVEGKHVLVVTRPHCEWMLAVMEGSPPRPMVAGPFTSLEAAEWPVFQLRWQMLDRRPARPSGGATAVAPGDLCAPLTASRPRPATSPPSRRTATAPSSSAEVVRRRSPASC